MRYIAKPTEPPPSIRDWLVLQLPVGLNVDFPSFNHKPALRAELIAAQHGLCAYTGAPIDDRLGGLHDANFVFHAHIEHVKARAVCRDELEAAGGVYGRDLCEDMDHRNLVAALEVKRQPPAKSEIFGAAAHGDELLPVTPLQPDCEERFRFDDIGGLHGLDAAADQTIRLLKLDHTTLVGWRCAAIAAFFPADLHLTREEIEQLVERLNQPVHGKLPEFAFCIRSYARSLLS